MTVTDDIRRESDEVCSGLRKHVTKLKLDCIPRVKVVRESNKNKIEAWSKVLI